MDISKIKQNKSLKELLEFGIINIDKPSGPTSFTVSDKVKKMLGLRKTSHFGTLDPKVTGVLPIALNRACKFTGFFIGHDKEYVGIMRMHEEVDIEKIKQAIKEKFTGVITQLPPVKSRVKRQEREREIKNFELIEQNGKDIVFRTTVQGGTYIRKLISDLGDYLGIGAHMLELRRTRAGIFTEEKIYTLYDLEKAVNDEAKLKEMITPGEIISEIYPVVDVKKECIKQILHGSPIHDAFLVEKPKIKTNQRISIFFEDQFLGVFRVVNTKNVFAKSEFTFQPLKQP
ncbi:MAG: RNA-guided pseudouridylation complex pseudouridine synthase subunit Cbf5 [Nanoarchaeota archaeon]|nr:RNA-guided pseudouridylation complex pseudouridine synthase subunit Cbf5 [Nanoarchaeota archaeon]